jgi:hypothetical protein
VDEICLELTESLTTIGSRKGAQLLISQTLRTSLLRQFFLSCCRKGGKFPKTGVDPGR